MNTKKRIAREIEVEEICCDVTGKRIATVDPDGTGEVERFGFRLHLEAIGKREDGSMFTQRIPAHLAPAVTAKVLAELLGTEALGELFPGVAFHPNGGARLVKQGADYPSGEGA